MLRYRSGFTIVELLVVIVVIGVLAAISLVSYSGINSQAIVASLQSDLTSSSNILKLFSVENGSYPTTVSTDCVASPDSNTNKCLKLSSGNTVYYYSGTSTGFTLRIKNGSTIYAVSDNSSPLQYVASTLVTWNFIRAGGYHTCGLSSSGRLYCWGKNDFGQLGDGTNNNSSVPVAVDMTGSLNGKTIVNLGVGNNHSCVRTSEPKVYCWGSNSLGQLGDGTNNNSSVPVAVDSSSLGGVSLNNLDLASGITNTTCSNASDGQVYCWGNNANGQFGNGQLTNSLVPILAMGGNGMPLRLGSAHSCSTTVLYCTGQGAYGQLGNGTTAGSTTPVSVTTSGALSGKTVNSLGLGSSHTCAMSTEPKVYCWGRNNYGQLGDGTTNNSSVPVALNTSGALSGKTLGASALGLGGGLFNCIGTTDNGIYCWGRNDYGQLGDGTNNDGLTPTAVSMSGAMNGKTSPFSLSAGGSHICVKSSDNYAYCWGRNDYGQLGNNSTINASTPRTVRYTYE